MSDTKTRSITDINRLRGFGQNVELCAQIKGRTLQSVAKGAKVSTSLLSSFTNGEGGVLTADILEGLSLEFGLTCLELLGTHGTVERKTAVFKELFGMLPSSKVEVHDYDHSLMRQSRSIVGQIGRRHGDPSEANEENEEAQAEPLAPEPPEEEPLAAEPEPEEPLLTARLIEPGIEWGQDGYTVRCAGKLLELKNVRVRRLVAEHIKLAKRNKMSATELGSRLQPPKKPSWMSNLNNGVGELNQKILEQVASICRVSVTFLLTGKDLSAP